MQKNLLIIKICDFVVKYSIYALIFLLPIFFLPWTTEVIDYNKQIIFLVLVLFSFFAWMMKALILGKFGINKSPMHIVAGIFFLVYLLATIFSVYKHGSFWGQPQQASESMLTLVCLLLFYFLVSNVFSKKNILTSVIVLSFSAVIAELIGVLQLFNLFIFPFSFSKSVIFNTIGSAGSLGIFAAVLIPLAIALAIICKNWWRILFIFQIILSVVILILLNFTVVWWVAVAVSAIFMTLGITKRDFFDVRWMSLPMFFLAVSLFFILLNLQINWLAQKPNEIFISQRAGFDIAMQSIKERPLFGSGPGTFAYNFSKFKSPDFSSTSLWNVVFNKSSSKFLNNLATTGVIGFLAILVFLIYPVFLGIKFLVKNNSEDPILLAGLSTVLAGQIVAFFLYNSNFVLDFLYFFTIAAIICFVSKNKIEHVLKPSSLITLTATLIFTLIFIFGIGLLILSGQKYLAEVNYYKALVAYQSNQEAEGLKKLESAVKLNFRSDLYLRQLSQAYLLSLQQELKNAGQNPNDETKTRIQTLLSNSINAGKAAADANPQNVNNWLLLGYVYQNLIGIANDAQKWAISAYDSALKLDPNNPYVFYSLGFVYDQMNQKSKAIEQFEKVQQLSPQNTDIAKILDNLKAGRPALQSAGSEGYPPPVENPSNGTGDTIKNPPIK